MKSLLRASLAILFGVVNFTTPGDAQDAVRMWDNALSLDGGSTHLDYQESYRGANLDSEKGWLPTATLGAGLLASDYAQGLARNLYARLELTGSVGNTTYDGSLCNIFGHCIPSTSTTKDAIYGVSGRIGRGFPLEGGLILIPFAQVDYRYWNRKLTGPGGYGEVYDDWAGLAGVMAQIGFAPGWVASLSGAGGTLLTANMNDGIADFPLGNAAIWQVRAQIGWSLTPHIELTGSTGYDSFSYKASPVVYEPSNIFCARGCIEPDSATLQITLTGVAYRF
jgi:hypothetical protein